VALWRNGRALHARSLVLQVLPSKFIGRQGVHVGITCSSKVAGAVVRNKEKRRLRSLIREHCTLFIADTVYVFIAKIAIRDCSFSDIKRDFLYLLKKGALK